MCLEPVRAGACFNFSLDAVGEVDGILHGIEDDGAGLIGLAGGHFEEEFVMYLEEHAGL